MKKRITWEEFDEMCYKLANKIQASGKKYDVIDGIPRGGLIIAVRLSHILGIRFDTETKYNEKMLVVDDISDSGATLNKIRSELDTATLHYREGSKHKPTYWVEEKKEDWIVYPWEE